MFRLQKLLGGGRTSNSKDDTVESPTEPTQYDSPSGSDKPSYVRRRTSTFAAKRIRAAERWFEGQENQPPVQLVVFDLDETLTLATFCVSSQKWENNIGASLHKDIAHRIVEYSFESPYLDGSRVRKLQNMLRELANPEGVQRTLAILTNNAGGAVGVLNFLMTAKLADHFSAIWRTDLGDGKPCGVYRDVSGWHSFSPPFHEVPDRVHSPTERITQKADVLWHIAENPEAWFPQMHNGSKEIEVLVSLKHEGIVLIDDDKSNFESVQFVDGAHAALGVKVLRYCKVARYDDNYRDHGYIQGLGGIGAHSDADYEHLLKFIKHPWRYKETLECTCVQQQIDDDFSNLFDSDDPVFIVVFDFDETLTMATFMPNDRAHTINIGWTPGESDWSKEDLVRYNFESPFVEGSRVAKLEAMLHDIARVDDAEGQRRTLAILTRNTSGAVAVLNLLMLAGLADHFSAIWSMPNEKLSNHDASRPCGVYRSEAGWKTFNPPLDRVHSHKADVIHDIAKNPATWLPQLVNFSALVKVRPAQIVLVDDERINFHSDTTKKRLFRFCKVARYDDTYRDCGFLNQMGGIGAHRDEDYESLKSFLEAPWKYAEDDTHHVGPQESIADAMGVTLQIQCDLLKHDHTQEISKLPRSRKLSL